MPLGLTLLDEGHDIFTQRTVATSGKRPLSGNRSFWNNNFGWPAVWSEHRKVVTPLIKGFSKLVKQAVSTLLYPDSCLMNEENQRKPQSG
jgi:hypothetical protein